MIKITGKLCFLALCLSLVIGIALTSPTEAEEDDQSFSYKGLLPAKEAEMKSDVKQQPVVDQQPVIDQQPIVDQPVVEEPNVEINNGVKPIGTPLSQLNSPNDSPNDSPTPSPNPAPGIFYTVLMIVPSLLVVLCLGLIYSLNERWKERLKKIAPPKSEGSTRVNTEQDRLSKIEKRMSEIEKSVSDLKEAVRYLLQKLETREKENKEWQQPQESPQSCSSFKEIPAINNQQKIYTEDTSRQIQPFDKGSSTFSSKSEKQKIKDAFNKMVIDATRVEGMNLWKLRNKFIMDYNVIAFKCVNYQERVNHQEEKPRFEMCPASESTLWRIQLSDRTFAVLPGLREYESTAHLQGGMKELFDSNYVSGTYRKIEVIRPAIVKRDFSIIEQGELHLSQY